ncbi:DUF7168 domain-containing protein [Oceaniradius stylonematis]|uniref:DUF7168 domain-containing protein n=1 Tax=Oceaniradius stylonematis TaxID=2184161 RepID=UPI00273ECDBA|nr:DUF2786 domain-containing protein [Oceaniradius stylonematis]
MTDRAAILDRIRKLLAMTPERGCSEAEAMSAAAKAAALMTEHGLSADEVEFDHAEVNVRSAGRSERSKLWPVIAYCTNSAVILIEEWPYEPRVRFVGLPPAPEVATYLWTVCDRAIDHELARFKQSSQYQRRRLPKTRRRATEDFTAGMVQRLTGRLYQLFKPTLDERLRRQAVLARDAASPNSQVVNHSRKRKRDGCDTDAGWAAGSRPSINHGVGGRAVRQIGGKT